MKLSKKNNVLIFSANIRGEKAFAAEQKIRELIKLLLKSKRLNKLTSSEHLDPKNNNSKSS